MIDTLNPKQRAHLRSLAHHLKPILHVGAEGVTDAVVDSVREAFNTRELLKLKVHETAPVDVDAAASEIAGSIRHAHVAQTIGRTMVLYRPFPDDRVINLPR
jgi:RNA-binding protein